MSLWKNGILLEIGVLRWYNLVKGISLQLIHLYTEKKTFGYPEKKLVENCNAAQEARRISRYKVFYSFRKQIYKVQLK